MGTIDGRKLGGTGEHRGSATPDREIDRHKVDKTNVSKVECVEEDDNWSCKFNGSGAGYRGQSIHFDEINVDGAESTVETTESGRRVVNFNFPQTVDCRIDRLPYQTPESDKKLKCPA